MYNCPKLGGGLLDIDWWIARNWVVDCSRLGGSLPEMGGGGGNCVYDLLIIGWWIARN